MQFLSLLRRELNAQVRSVKFSVLTITALALAVLSVHMGRSDLTTRQRASQQLLDQQSADQSRDNRLLGASVEPTLRAVRTPNELSALVRGIDEVLPAYWDFSPAGARQGPSAMVQQATPDAGIRIDLQFLVGIVLGLLALLSGLDCVLIDRESGTLHALLSQPISKFTILVGKASGGMVALLLSLTLVLGGALAAAAGWMPGLSMTRLVMLTAILGLMSLAYLLTLFSSGLLLATAFRSGWVLQSLSIVVWLYLSVITPSLLPLIGRSVSAAPSRQSVEAQLQSTYASGFRKLQETLGNGVPYRPGTSIQIEPGTVTQLEQGWSAGLTNLRRQLTGMEDAAAQSVKRQREAVWWLSLLSPATQLDNGLAALAGTGSMLQTVWEAGANGYQRNLNKVLFDSRPRVTMLVPNGQGRSIVSIDLKAPIRRTDVPSFRISDPSFRERLREALPEMAVLTIYSAVLLAIAFAAFSRSAI